MGQVHTCSGRHEGTMERFLLAVAKLRPAVSRLTEFSLAACGPLACGLAVFVAALSPTAPLAAPVPPVYTVLFTHIEDNTPGGLLGSPQSRQQYLLYRSRLIGMANLARDSGVPWSLQPDWKILEAALIYEDSTLMASTNDKNFLRYLKEDLGAVIDPHSHENYGYNYTDVAHLLDSLGVGATTVIGGHIWDPNLPQFQEWDRFRVPVQGERYPNAWWRGDILMGSGTPNHVNDPVVSGVWRPQDRYHYFVHDPEGNIAAIGQYRGTLECIPELVALYTNGVVPTEFMLTSSYHITPARITSPGGLGAIADSVIAPVLALRDAGLCVPTDFTSLVATWATVFGARGFIYDANAPVGIESGAAAPPDHMGPVRCFPNPALATTVIEFVLARRARVRLAVDDVAGREVARLVDGWKEAGRHAVPWVAGEAANGVYLYRLEERIGTGVESGAAAMRGKVVVDR